MGRKATGTVRILKNEDGEPQWHAKWTRADGTRTEWTAIDPSIPLDDEAAAKACAARMAPKVRAKSAADAKGKAETVGEWFGRLHAAKEARGLSSVKDMRGRATKWILPGIEHKRMADLSREDVEAIVGRLDLAVASFQKHGPGEGRLSPSTAQNVWGDLTHALDEAVRAKDPALRVLAANPSRDVRGPDAGDERVGQILYSDELVKLLRGVADETDGKRRLDVPLYRRQVYAMAVYTEARASELEALTAADIDLAHGTISVVKQTDRASKGRKDTKATKTKRVRTVDVEPHLRPLLEHLVEHPQGKRGRLLRMPPPEDRAELLRKDLRTVGVVREALHVEGDPLRRSIVFHDLRDTGLTHMAVRGDHPTAIQWRAGHSDYKMTSSYIDRGRVEAKRIGDPLPPLPLEVLPDPPKGIAPKSTRYDSESTKQAKTSTTVATPTGIEGATEDEPSAGKEAVSALRLVNESPQAPTVRDESRPSVTDAGTEPLNVNVLRRKLDAAIVAEAWDAVRVIRDRIVETERSAMGNVFELVARRHE